MVDEIQQHLESLARDDCYRVDAVLKAGELESTERVFFVGANGAEQGPYVRKRFDCESGLGGAYRRILAAQRSGERFLHLPRIIDCYSAGEQDVVVMELIGGRTLADEVYACDPSVDLARRLFPQACEAVRELHERFDPPLIHRDVKPSNLMVSGPSVIIIDLGIARTFDELAATDTSHFGTRAYAPPEQFGYGQTDVRSDVYALGMLLFYLLCEKTPQVGRLDAELESCGVPQALRDVVAQATAFDPKARFRSVAALEAAFDAVAAGLGDEAAGAGAGKRKPCDEAVPAKRRPSTEAADSGSAPIAPTPQPTAATAPAARPATTAPHGVSAAVPTSSRPRTVHPLRAWRNLLSRIPVGVGIAWDTFLALWMVFFGFVCWHSTFHPVGDPARLPFWACAASYALTWCIMEAPVSLVFDARPFRSWLPGSGKIGIKLRLIAFAVLFVGGVVGLILIGNLVLPNYP